MYGSTTPPVTASTIEGLLNQGKSREAGRLAQQAISNRRLLLTPSLADRLVRACTNGSSPDIELAASFAGCLGADASYPLRHIRELVALLETRSQRSASDLSGVLEVLRNIVKTREQHSRSRRRSF